MLTEFKDERQSLSLKTITLQLLLNKMPQFATGLSKVQERDMTRTFQPLLETALSMLEGKNSEKQGLTIALFSILQRTTSTLLPQATKARALKLVLQYLAEPDQWSLLLHSQLLLTATTIFEIYHLEVLENL